MPKLPFAKNETPPKKNYESKILYDFYYREDASQFDTWYNIPYYGKVNEQGSVVYPKELYLEVVSKTTDEDQALCLNFVADAFREMRKHYETLYLDGYLEPGSSYFTRTLEPKKGWQSPNQVYVDNQQETYEDFLSTTLFGLTESNLIKNFDDFVIVFLDYIRQKETPFTRIGLHESNKASLFTTGLVLEVLQSFYGDDQKAIAIVNDPNFGVFEELCKRYGFRIDRNNPWRIIFNIVSNNSSDYINKQSGAKSFNLASFFETFYQDLNVIDYFQEFYTYLKIYYATFIAAYPLYREDNLSDGQCKKAFYSYKNRGPVPYLENNLSNEKLLELFYDFRVAEAGLKVSNERRSYHLKSCLSIYKTMKANIGTEKTEKALKKSLDYIQFNLGTIAFRDVPLEQNNLTRLNGGAMMSAQSQFEKETGEDSSYLNDFSGS